MSLEILLVDMAWSAAAALGFAVLFNVPGRTLIGCTIAGAVGHGLRTMLVQVGMSTEMASLVGAAAVGFLSEAFARRWRTPRTVFAVPGVIPMLPGSLAFRAMLDIVQLAALPGGDLSMGMPLLYDAVLNVVKTGLILTALAVGITAPKLLFYRPRPVV